MNMKELHEKELNLPTAREFERKPEAPGQSCSPGQHFDFILGRP